MKFRGKLGQVKLFIVQWSINVSPNRLFFLVASLICQLCGSQLQPSPTLSPGELVEFEVLVVRLTDF